MSYNVTGRIVLSNGSFMMKIKLGSVRCKSVDCSLIQKFDGYSYGF